MSEALVGPAAADSAKLTAMLVCADAASDADENSGGSGAAKNSAAGIDFVFDATSVIDDVRMMVSVILNSFVHVCGKDCDGEYVLEGRSRDADSRDFVRLGDGDGLVKDTCGVVVVVLARVSDALLPACEEEREVVSEPRVALRVMVLVASGAVGELLREPISCDLLADRGPRDGVVVAGPQVSERVNDASVIVLVLLCVKMLHDQLTIDELDRVAPSGDIESVLVLVGASRLELIVRVDDMSSPEIECDDEVDVLESWKVVEWLLDSDLYTVGTGTNVLGAAVVGAALEGSIVDGAAVDGADVEGLRVDGIAVVGWPVVGGTEVGGTGVGHVVIQPELHTS